MTIGKPLRDDLADASDKMLDTRTAELSRCIRVMGVSPFRVLAAGLLIGVPIILLVFPQLDSRFYACCAWVILISVLGFNSIEWRRKLEAELASLTRLTPTDSDYCERALRIVQSSKSAQLWVANALNSKRDLRYFDFDMISFLHARDVQQHASEPAVRAFNELHGRS